ncbi:AraC family transcriptional regulator [Jannaschia sp. LMIT008]|uniref:AraC family transcriptional regulator n=1 Tax=Jannaschia maritima TaxID=3032585 RepID=UPI0035AB74A2
MAAGLDASGDWAIRFERHAGMKCNAIVRGGCWLSVDGGRPTRLEAGTCFILPHGRPFLISSSGQRNGMAAETIYAPVPHGGTVVHGDGGEFYMTGSRFLLGGKTAEVLLAPLPPVLIVTPGAESAAVAWALDHIAAELREPRPGTALSIEHLSHFLLVQAMRRYLDSGHLMTGGWLAALSDPQIVRAVAAMHADPGHAWTVEDLARRAGLSRTSLTVRFRRVTGQTPIAYLTDWRMLLAAERLRRTGDPIAGIAADLGYASESAFSVAFRRTMGTTPRRHARSSAE